MTEERKAATLFASTPPCVQKRIETIDSDKLNFPKHYFVDRAIQEAE